MCYFKRLVKTVFPTKDPTEFYQDLLQLWDVIGLNWRLIITNPKISKSNFNFRCSELKKAILIFDAQNLKKLF